MNARKNLTEAVTVNSQADALIEALLPLPHDHRAGSHRQAEEILARDPRCADSHIWAACAAGQLPTVKRLLEVNPSLANARGGTRNWEPLLYLCFSRFLPHPERHGGFLEIGGLLLQHGADPNAHWIDPNEAEGNRETPLYAAAGIANCPNLARLLIEAGADPNDGETAYHMVEHEGVPSAEFIFPKLEPLHRGIALGHQLDYDDLPGLHKLLELGADPNGPTPFVNLPIHQAVWRGRSREFFDLLIEFGADVDAPNKNDKTAYALAARCGRREIMSWLEELGASTQLGLHDQLLSACTLADQPTAARLLQDHPGLLSQLNPFEQSSICEAAAAGNTQAVRLMLDLGWDVNAGGNVWGETPLHRAALAGNLETVRLLLDRGADLTLRDRCYRSSPLGWAKHEGRLEVVQLLCSDPSRLDLLDAIECGHAKRVLELLEGQDVNQPLAGADPGVLLRAAVHHENVQLVEALLSRGADPTLENREGMSAIDLARQRGHDAILARLKREIE